MSERLSLEQAAKFLADFGMTQDDAAKFLLFVAVFLDVSTDENGKKLTASYREGRFIMKQEGKTVLHEVESLDEQALQEQAVQLELFPEDPPEDSWEPSPAEALQVFMEYDDLTGDFDE